MKKIIFGIFAHPDDEAFGPSGTMLMEVQNGAELHLITLTAGENGMNPDNHENLQEVRLREWREAGELMGASGMFHLGFVDGELNNTTLLQAVEKIELIVRNIVGSHQIPAEVEFISIDTNGITGHIDHIVASRAAHHVFYKLRREGLPLTKLRLACIPREYTGDEPNIDFVFMESGRTAREIDEIIDARHYREQIIAIMRAHHTQRGDGEQHIATRDDTDTLGINHFIVLE